MVEIRSKIFLSRAAALSLALTTARLAAIGAVRLQVVRRWSGNSEGFVTTVVNLPFIETGGRIRWRMATDNSDLGEGWRVDTVNISWCEPVPGCSPTPRPHVTPAPRPCRPHRQALTLRRDLLRHRVQARDRR